MKKNEQPNSELEKEAVNNLPSGGPTSTPPGGGSWTWTPELGWQEIKFIESE